MSAEDKNHWAAQNERGNALFLKITTFMVRYLPALLLKPCIGLVVLYFYLSAPKPRHYIAQYQNRLRATFPNSLPAKNQVFRQFLAFGEAICDRFAVWQHKICYQDLQIDDPDGISDLLKPKGRGQIFACSHLGNTEICRALVSHHVGFKLNVLVHNKHAQAFNTALENAGADRIQLIQVTDLDAALMMELSKRIDNGEWIALAADRAPLRGEKTVSVHFLGQEAQFPQGTWLLAALLKTQVNTLFCVKQNGRYHLKLRRLTDAINGKRQYRQAAVSHAAQQFTDILAQECQQNPLQWFNFYDFWKDQHG